ncbi:MAG: zf-HC2 domain-containing protein [Longimicrobiales bacterium]
MIGESSELTCAAFLAAHSDYVDGLVPVAELARFEAHARRCAHCARYDRAVRRAPLLLRQLEPVGPSDDFEARLRHRLLHEEEARRAAPRFGPGVAAAILIAAGVAVAAWNPLLRAGEAEPTAAALLGPSDGMPVAGLLADSRTVDVHRLVAPLLAHAGARARPLLLGDAGASPLFFPVVAGAIAPGPFSPLVIMPPAARIGTGLAAPAVVRAADD